MFGLPHESHDPSTGNMSGSSVLAGQSPEINGNIYQFKVLQIS